MAVGEVNGGRSQTRAGASALALLASPTNGQILQALSEGPAKVGSLEAQLTPNGRDLLFVTASLEGWLLRAPDKALPYGSAEGQEAIGALVEGWSSTIVHTLAAEPHSLTELDRAIDELSYTGLELRLEAMRRTGQVEPRSGDGETGPHAVTDWLREGIAPLIAGARWERRHVAGETTPVARLDVEAAFLLVVPLLRFPADLSGSCRLGVELGAGKERELAGATIRVEDGHIASCIADLKADCDARATGDVDAWFSAMIDGDLSRFELGGDRQLAAALLKGLHATLFGPALSS